jgi:hypothetical protein
LFAVTAVHSLNFEEAVHFKIGKNHPFVAYYRSAADVPDELAAGKSKKKQTKNTKKPSKAAKWPAPTPESTGHKTCFICK